MQHLIFSVTSRGQGTRRAFIGIGIALALLVWLSTSFALALPANASPDTADWVNADGTLNVTRSGVLDLRGWAVRLDPQRGPVLKPQAPNAEAWSPMGIGMDGDVYAIAVMGSDVYVGGQFVKHCANNGCSSFDTTFNHIAKWSTLTNTWSPVGSGVNNYVYTFVVNGSDLYVGGTFNQLCGNSACDSGNTSARFVAKWDGSAWSALGNGLDGGGVYAMTLGGSDLYAGGGVYRICANAICDSGTGISNLARWSLTGAAWTPVATGVTGQVFALETLGTDVYVGGEFTQVCGTNCASGNTTVNYIAKWNGASWSALGSGLSHAVLDLYVNGNNLYVGGAFTSVCGNTACTTGNTTANHIAKWNSGWSKLGNGTSAAVRAITMYNNTLYAGGNFQSVCGNAACDANNVQTNYVAKWDGSTWSGVSGGTNSVIHTMNANAGKLYTGGNFSWLCSDLQCNTIQNAYRIGQACLDGASSPTLVSPANGAKITKNKVPLKWNDAGCGATYKVTVKDKATNATVFKKSLAAGVTQVKTTALTKGKTYKWFIQACNGAACVKSTTQQFFIKP